MTGCGNAMAISLCLLALATSSFQRSAAVSETSRSIFKELRLPSCAQPRFAKFQFRTRYQFLIIPPRFDTLREKRWRAAALQDAIARHDTAGNTRSVLDCASPLALCEAPKLRETSASTVQRQYQYEWPLFRLPWLD